MYKIHPFKSVIMTEFLLPFLHLFFCGLPLFYGR